jgi:hypothetical protein
MYFEVDGGRQQGASQLLSYIACEPDADRDHEQEPDRDRTRLYNRSGDEMSDREIQRFIDRSKQYEYERQAIISPEFGDELSNEELSLATRETMSELVGDQPTATYCYAIHRDTDHAHAQVALTGSKRDLWTDQDDLDRAKERAIEQTREREIRRERERHREREQERERQRENRRERSPDFSFR